MTAGVQVLGGSGGGRLARRIVGFVRLLRDNGFAAGPGESMDALRLARGCDLGDPTALRGGLRALLCASRLDWRRFDELFDAYWLGRGMKRAALAGPGGEAPAGNETTDLEEAVRGSKVVYARSWQSIESYGNPTLAASARSRNTDWTIKEPLLAQGDDPFLMHAMPVRRNLEVADAVLDGARSLLVEQAANRLHTTKALLTLLLRRR